ncbi:MAG TPA: EutP/PduV family microcompartment system protein [Ignavibacteriaceae bacterium]|nr:MAG: Propanediol utilization protein PduV [Ignavibacteria bacterium ADurb.Bin266]HQF43168.1 EutP/PduV family microcompartment system protein [Ignavibacteriaceae bacterium]
MQVDDNIMTDKLTNFILIGGVGVGKTSLFNMLLGIEDEAMKTQALVYHNEKTVDTPGEYFDSPRLYSAIIQTMSDIDTIIYVHPANSTERKLPHGLFQIYNSKRLVGVISKTDLPDADVDAVEEILRDFGIDGEIFKVSIYSESSIDKLREFLSKEY